MSEGVVARPRRGPAARHGRRPHRLVEADRRRARHDGAASGARRAVAHHDEHDQPQPRGPVRRAARRGLRRDTRGDPHRAGRDRRVPARPPPGRARLPAGRDRRRPGPRGRDAGRRRAGRRGRHRRRRRGVHVPHHEHGVPHAARRRGHGRHAPELLVAHRRRAVPGRGRVRRGARGRHGPDRRHHRQAVARLLRVGSGRPRPPARARRDGRRRPPQRRPGRAVHRDDRACSPGRASSGRTTWTDPTAGPTTSWTRSRTCPRSSGSPDASRDLG